MQAVILAAGMGRRLGKITFDKPKCMVPINGKPIIGYAVESLLKNQIKDILVVTGHREEVLKEYLLSTFREAKFTFVKNERYARTNNITSLYIALNHLKSENIILLESDILFEPELTERLKEENYEAVAVVDRYRPWMSGTVVLASDQDFIESFVTQEAFNPIESDRYLKTVNIYRFSRKFLNEIFKPFIESYIQVFGEKEYYEVVLKVISNIDKVNIKVLRVRNEKWYEVDTVHDIEMAEAIFGSDQKRIEKISKRYGGYWRNPEIRDFCYLVNPFFPTQEMEKELEMYTSKMIRTYPSGRETINNLASSFFSVDPNYIMVGNGASELIDALSKIVQGKGMVPAPTFEEYPQKFKGLSPVEVENDNLAYDPYKILEWMKDYDYLILINPDNPSGNFINKNGLVKILESMNEAGKLVILDESFVDFSDTGGDNSFLNDRDLERFGNLILIRSISKSFGVPGVRLGILATSRRDIIGKLKEYLPIWNINSLAEFFLEILPRYRKDYEQSCLLVKKERERFFKKLQNLKNITPLPSQGNYITLKLSAPLKAKNLTQELFKRGFLIKDLSGKRGIKGEYVRIAVNKPEDNDHLLEALQKIST